MAGSFCPREGRLRQLFATHHDFIWRVSRRFGLDVSEADDVAQEVFMIALTKLDAIQPGKERSYLYGTALRLSRNALRRRSKHEATSIHLDETEPCQRPLPDAMVELSRSCAQLDLILSRMPERLARVIVLAQIEQLDIAEIAELESIPVGTVASRLRKGRELLRKHLEGRHQLASESEL